MFRRFPVNLALASSIFVGVSVFSYFTFLALVGYTYELLLFSNITFVAVGLLFFKGFRGSSVTKAVEKASPAIASKVPKVETPEELEKASEALKGSRVGIKEDTAESLRIEKNLQEKTQTMEKNNFLEKKGGFNEALGFNVPQRNASLVVGLLPVVVVLALVEEVLLNSAFAWYGLALAFLGFVLFPIVGVLIGGRGEVGRVVFEVCGLLFATRIVFSPFPISLLESAAFLPVVYTLIVSAIVLYLWFRRIPLGKVGLSRGLVRLPFQVLAGVSVGLVLGLIENFVLNPQSVNVGSSMVSNIVYLVVTMMVFVGLTEELLFRGLLQSYMAELMPKWQAVHLTALIFSLFHIGWLNPLEVVFAYGAGVVFGYLLIKTGGLTAPVVAHGFGNIVLYILALVV